MKAVFSTILAFTAISAGLTSALTVNSWTRSLDLASPLVKMSNSISFEATEKTSEFEFVLEEDFRERVSFIGATTDKTHLRVSESKGGAVPTWKIQLKKPLNKGDKGQLDVEVILSKAVELFPKEITQKEKQFILYNGNYYALSKYPVKTQTTKIQLPNSQVENYSKSLKPVSLSDSTLTLGPYKDVAPLSVEDFSVHYQNNNPFLTVSKMERVIELSMWGNIAIEETVDVRHSGAKLSGPYSRYEYQRENSGASAVKSFKTILPAAAEDVYYRDDIGNISTSAMRVLVDAVELELRPRFPLFGGWKTHYFIGYNVPSYEYLYTKGDNFALNMRVIDHVFDDMLVEDFTLKIILPEGVEVGKLNSPFPLKREKDERHYTYLDTTGRPVIVLKNVGDLTEKHIQDFQLEFKFPKSAMIREPLMLILAFFLFFLSTIIYVRLDFSITKNETSETRLKAAGVMEKIFFVQEKRNSLYGQYEDALGRLKSIKDVSAFQTNVRKINSDLKAETQNISDLAANLRMLAAENGGPATRSDFGEKIADLQKWDRIIREQQTSQALIVEKLVGGRVNKQQFLDQESVFVRRRDEALERINHISSFLRGF